MLFEMLMCVFVLLIALNGIGLHFAIGRVERERMAEDTRIIAAYRREIDTLRRDMEANAQLGLMWENDNGTEKAGKRNSRDGEEPSRV